MASAATISAQGEASGGWLENQLKLEDFPIPDHVEVDGDWSQQMREIAHSIGAHATLRLCGELGGQTIYVPQGFSHGDKSGLVARLRSILGLHGLSRLCQTLGGCHVTVPRAHTIIARAKRAVVIAHARAGTLTIATTAAIIGVTRNYAGHLVNHTQEGIGISPSPLPLPRDQRLLNGAAAAAASQLGKAGIEQGLIEDVASSITRLNPYRLPMGDPYLLSRGDPTP